MGVGDPNAQTIQKLKKYRTGPQKTGGSLQDVVRTCVYVFKIADWEKVGEAGGEVFGQTRPATTLGNHGAVPPVGRDPRGARVADDRFPWRPARNVPAAASTGF